MFFLGKATNWVTFDRKDSFLLCRRTAFYSFQRDVGAICVKAENVADQENGQVHSYAE